MSTQPYLCRFSYAQYLSKLRPTFQEILVGNWPEWLVQKYQLSLSELNLPNRLCPRQRFADCDCLTEDLIFQTFTPCMDYSQWSDLRLLRLFEKLLLDTCVIDYICLPKKLIYLDRIWDEAFAEIGLIDPVFRALLSRLCSRWTNTWLDCDNQGVSGYLVTEEVAQLHDYLNMALTYSPQYSTNSNYSKEDFDEFIATLQAIHQLAGDAIESKDGLFWSHDLISIHR